MKTLLNFFFFFLILQHLLSASTDTIDNIIIYRGGNVQINAIINDEYASLAPGKTLHGSIFVTHDAGHPVGPGNFFIGDKPLSVTYSKSTQMSSYSPLEVSVYQFELPGLTQGVHTLAPISVKIGSNKIQAEPIVVEIP